MVELRYIHSARFPTVILKTMDKACPVMEHYLGVPLLTVLLKIIRQVPEALSMRVMLIIVHSLEIERRLVVLCIMVLQSIVLL